MFRYICLFIVCAVTLFPTIIHGEMSKAKQKPEASPGWIVIEEDVVDVFVDEPSAAFSRARENFINKDLKAAAQDIRIAAAFVKLEAARATKEGKKGLVSSYQELEKLADKIEKGKVKSVRDLEKVFARTHHALAKHYLTMAEVAWATKEENKTGYFLKTALSNLEHGLTLAGEKMDAGFLEAFKDIRILSGKLIEGAGWVPDEVGKGISWVGKEIEKFGSTVEGK